MGTGDIDRFLQRYTVDAWSRGDFSGFDELIAEDYVLDPGTMGPDEFKAVVRTYREAFPDLALTVLETVVEGDRIAYRWQMSGTHRGTFQGIAPTGRGVSGTGMTFLTLRDGAVVHDCFESSSPPFEQVLAGPD